MTIYTVSFILAQVVFFIFGYHKGKMEGIESDTSLFTGIKERIKDLGDRIS